MNKVFFKDALKKPELFSAILDFNFSILQKKEEQSLALLAGQNIPLEKIPSAALKKYIQKSIGTEQTGFWDFTEETRRLALLDTDTLLALMNVTGISLNAKEIAKTVQKEEVAKIKQAIGGPLYHYALTRGQYRLGTLQTFFPPDGSLSLLEKIQKQGEQALAYCIQNWSEELKTLFFKKHALPQSFFTSLEEIKQYPLNPKNEILIWFSVKKILIKEINHSWAPYFN